MTHYKVVFNTNHDPFLLAKQVEDHLVEGWELVGGLAVDKSYLYQALVLHPVSPTAAESLAALRLQLENHTF